MAKKPGQKSRGSDRGAIWTSPGMVGFAGRVVAAVLAEVA